MILNINNTDVKLNKFINPYTFSRINIQKTCPESGRSVTTHSLSAAYL